MPRKKKPKPTYVYELVVTFSAREERLFFHVEEKDRQRLLGAIADEREKHGFYEVGGGEGHHCTVNTTHITRLNVLDYLPGIEFEAEPELTDKQWQKKFEERETSDEPVILRLWLRGIEEPIVHDDVDYNQWQYFKIGLLSGEKFICFTDEDDEDVIYGTDHLDAIEVIDSFYLKEEQVKKLLSRYDDEKEAPAEAVRSPAEQGKSES